MVSCAKRRLSVSSSSLLARWCASQRVASAVGILVLAFPHELHQDANHLDFETNISLDSLPAAIGTGGDGWGFAVGAKSIVAGGGDLHVDGRSPSFCPLRASDGSFRHPREACAWPERAMEGSAGGEGGNSDWRSGAEHAHSQAHVSGKLSIDLEHARPAPSQEMQFGAAEVHTAVPHAAGQSAPATTMGDVQSKRRTKLSLSENNLEMHLVELLRVPQMKRHLLPRAPSRPVECASLPSDAVQAGAVRLRGVRRIRAFTCGCADASAREVHSSGGRAPSHQADARLVLGRRRGWGEWRVGTMGTHHGDDGKRVDRYRKTDVTRLSCQRLR